MKNCPNWKRMIAVAVLLLGGTDAFALVYKRRARYEQDTRSPESIRKQAAKHDVDAILVLGTRKDTSAQSILRRMAQTSVPAQTELAKTRHTAALIQLYGESSFAAKMALARMGNSAYFDEFVAGLSSASVVWRGDCISALGYVGDKRAIKYLGPLLSQEQTPAAPPGYASDIVFPSNSAYAQTALEELLPEVSKTLEKDWKADTKKSKYRPASSELWKWWWAKNKDKYK